MASDMKIKPVHRVHGEPNGRSLKGCTALCTVTGLLLFCPPLLNSSLLQFQRQPRLTEDCTKQHADLA